MLARITKASRRRFNTARAGIAVPKLPDLKNDTFLDYKKGSPELAKLQASINRMKNECPELPVIVGGKEIRTNSISKQLSPHDWHKPICTYHAATPAVMNDAINAALQAKKDWEALPWEHRLAIFVKAGDLLSTKYRADLCAATILGQSKNIWQAEIDAAVETIDFFRLGAAFVEELYRQQPRLHSPFTWNRLEYRALEGFVLAITPFNFTAIGANLPSAPAMMGNAVLWKPSSTSVLSNYITYKILEEAGLPPGVINFVPGRGPVIGNACFPHPDFAGLHFTGSTDTFQGIWRQIGNNINNYKSYPRVVGETGGKNFHFVHASAKNQLDNVVYNTIRGAFEYQGQKCSATSRLYVPASLWPEFKERMLEEIKKIKMGDPAEPDTFMGAVIDEASYKKIYGYIEAARASDSAKILCGGNVNMTKGYFIEPTVIEVHDPHFVTMKEEIFGPVLSVFVYADSDYEEALELCDLTTPFALTGSIFASDRYALEKAFNALRHSAGNFYINDKSTGAIVGQQPFGGGRASGTNDKAGWFLNYTRWISARSIKESTVPVSTWRYPHMDT